MSEFFKALEQADRDRHRLEGVKASERVTDGDKGESRDLVFERPTARPPAPREATRMPRVPESPTRGKSRPDLPVLVAQLEPNSIAAEAYRTLRTNLEFRAGRAAVSEYRGDVSHPREREIDNRGQSGGRRCSGWSARLPRRCRLLATGASRGVRPQEHRGLPAALEGRRVFHSVARETHIENLSVVVSGQNGGAPLSISSRRSASRRCCNEAGNDFDLVVYDTPPIFSVAETVTMPALCDGVIMVVRAGSLPLSVLQRAVQQIDQVTGAFWACS